MSEAEWTDALHTGDPHVDRQHANIHQLLHDIETAEDRPEEVMRALDRLMAHVDAHFATEEALMRRCGYDEDAARRHAREHGDLTQQARQMVLMFRKGELDSTRQLVTFLREWIVNHVHGQDRVFIEYARSCGMQAEPVAPEGV